MPTDISPNGTIESYLLHPVYMGDGEGKPDLVIVNNIVMKYVGIGWIPLRDATEEDKLTYPVAVDSRRKRKHR